MSHLFWSSHFWSKVQSDLRKSLLCVMNRILGPKRTSYSRFQIPSQHPQSSLHPKLCICWATSGLMNFVIVDMQAHQLTSSSALGVVILVFQKWPYCEKLGNPDVLWASHQKKKRENSHLFLHTSFSKTVLLKLASSPWLFCWGWVTREHGVFLHLSHQHLLAKL